MEQERDCQPRPKSIIELRRPACGTTHDDDGRPSDLKRTKRLLHEKYKRIEKTQLSK